MEETTKPGYRTAALKAVLGVLSALLSVTVTALLLYVIVLRVGVPAGSRSAHLSDTDVTDRYHMFATNAISDALDGVLAIDKVYWIGRDEPAAPRPNPACFGETSDPRELQWLVDDAAEFLAGEELVFSTDVKIMPGSVVRYYRDDTILAITWKQVIDYMVYTFSEVKIAHPSQFRRFLAGNEYGSDKLFITTEMAQSVNAVVASSGDFYRFRNVGIVVYDGIVRRANNGIADTCFVDYDGNLHFFGTYEYMNMETAQQYVDDNNISFSLVFGPILIRDGQIVTPRRYSLGEIDEEYARSALCQMGNLHYLLAVANSEGQWRNVPTIYQFAQRIRETGCENAYALDGGQTAVIAMNGRLINRVVYGYQRKISDIIYFGTAIPSHD